MTNHGASAYGEFLLSNLLSDVKTDPAEDPML